MRTAAPVLVVAFVVSVAAGPAFGDAPRDVLGEMAKCAEIADDALRLKCFDAAIPRAKSALAAPPEAPTKSGFLEWFGFSRPQTVTKAEDFGKPPPEALPGEINEISANVLEFAKTVRGKAVFILENGQVWRQLEGDTTVVVDPPQGVTMKVLIEHGVLGSYNLTIQGRNVLIKVVRLK